MPDPEASEPEADDKQKPEAPAAEEKHFVTHREGTFYGTRVSYRAIAGETHLRDKSGQLRASLFTFAYFAETDADPSERPLTFLFNGGPGSASLWLHMGAFGPVRVVVPGDASFPGAAPYRIEPNPSCPLDVTDLVFIDPVGTGFSRALCAAKPEDFWGLDADAALVADFITQFLTEHRRWASPRYLGGESYGTTRAIAVAGKLQSTFSGISFNGLVLISVVLDFHTVRFEKGNILPEVSYLPTYAAAALYHGRVKPTSGDRASFLDEVRRFALDEYAPALLAGTRIDPDRRKRVAESLARYTGLDSAWLDRTRLRIDPSRFRKELLRDRGVTIGRFDSRYLGADYDEAGEAPDDDPSAYAVKSAYTSAMQDYLGRDLGVAWGAPYVTFLLDAAKKWNWTIPDANEWLRWPGYVNVAPELGRLQRESPALKVLMANGIFDLATPFFAVENTIASNGIDASRIIMRYYDAGHMMYVNSDCLERLVMDFRALVGRAS
jgi:carboxypeptidase C (cathepsin A)